MNFKRELENLKEILDFELKKAIRPKNKYEQNITQAMEYSLFTGGKRIRPILCMKSFQLFSSEENFQPILPFAISIEMIHTYSLIHDDLPSMDNDDYRRGMMTSHKKFGEAMAILSGDGLLNLAFETMIKSISTKEDILALKKVAEFSGISGMIGGQVLDLHLERDNITREAIDYMYKNKTAALIQASVVAGGIIGGAEFEEIHLLESFGYNLGMAYQIKDDFLDLNEDEDVDKITYISFYGKEKSEKDLIVYTEKAIDILSMLETNDKNFFIKLIEELKNRDI